MPGTRKAGASPGILEIHNPAAVGWRGRRGDSEVEVAWPRGSNYLIMSSRSLPDGDWRPVCRMDDARWGVDGSLKDAKAKAEEFLEATAAEQEKAQ